MSASLTYIGRSGAIFEEENFNKNKKI